jgi:hypothetical protein
LPPIIELRAGRARTAILYLSLGSSKKKQTKRYSGLEFIADAGLILRTKLEDLISEAGQITAIMVASRRTAKNRNRKSEIDNRKFS